MDVDNAYDDLTALFAAEDKKLSGDGFVRDVMVPIRRPSAWRQALLFGATGIGLGAAGSQFIGLLGTLPDVDLDVGAELTSLQMLLNGIEYTNPIWLMSFVMVAVCLVMLTVFERA